MNPRLQAVPLPQPLSNTTLTTTDVLHTYRKSQIAIEYCHVFRDENPTARIIWIYGADPHHFEHGYQEIARRAYIPGWGDQKTDKLKLVQDWLQEDSTTEWLMVVDNADDAIMFLGPRQRGLSTNKSELKTFARFLPQCSHGRILITTRDRRFGERLSHSQGIIQIAPLSAENSKDLLRSKSPKRTGLKMMRSNLWSIFLRYRWLSAKQQLSLVKRASLFRSTSKC